MASKLKLNKEQFGPWALVTGASSGIGRELARQIAAQGINVVVAARRHELLQTLVAELQRDSHVEAKAVQVDLSRPDAAERLQRATEALDIGLVASNAGTATPGRFLEQELSAALELVALNTRTHFEVAYRFGRRLAQRGRGGLLLTGAMGAIDGVPYAASESASKSFVQTLGACLNDELGPSGVHVTVLVVAPTQTAIIDKFGLDPASMPFKPMPVEQCAREGLVALVKNRPTHINGRLNRVMNALVPVKLSKRVMKQMMERGLAVRTSRVAQ